MVDVTCVQFLAQPISCRKAKVYDGEAQATLEAGHVSGFRSGWYILHCVPRLHGDILNMGIITDVASIMQYLGEVVVVGCAIHYNIGLRWHNAGL